MCMCRRPPSLTHPGQPGTDLPAHVPRSVGRPSARDVGPSWSAARGPGRWRGAPPRAFPLLDFAGRRGRGRLATRPERRGGVPLLSPAGEVSPSSPRGRDGLANVSGRPSRLGRTGRIEVTVQICYVYCCALWSVVHECDVHTAHIGVKLKKKNRPPRGVPLISDDRRDRRPGRRSLKKKKNCIQTELDALIMYMQKLENGSPFSRYSPSKLKVAKLQSCKNQISKVGAFPRFACNLV